MEKYENPEYEMLKNSTEHIVQETSNNNKKANTPSDTANLKGIASLVLGLITIVINHLWYVSLITGILAIVFGVQSNIKGNKIKKGKAGMILGIIGLTLMLVVYGLATIIILVEYL
jgi:hypothetical protein